ncbi:hypothetical protein RHGRI_002582 [Rhododendron griersonianum]|uniref:Ribosomal protein S14 n=1 Tax=Rhododendron griersonianum TaxID=479676 RepID=A0AAV6LRQ2_9ERIC|nr:hypothetical protein RHGRI_002582 [Rhododendron griersonianum]
MKAKEEKKRLLLNRKSCGRSERTRVVATLRCRRRPPRESWRRCAECRSTEWLRIGRIECRKISGSISSED